MTTPLLRLYIAASLDGFIATSDGGVSWLDPYNEPELGYDQLMKSVGTVVMGRATYEQAIGFPGPWPNVGKKTIVLTSRPLKSPPKDVERWAGDVGSLADHLRTSSNKDVWICGGARTGMHMLNPTRSHSGPQRATTRRPVIRPPHGCSSIAAAKRSTSRRRVGRTPTSSSTRPTRSGPASAP